MAGSRKPRDLALIDAVDAFSRTPLTTTVWRVARNGRDPLQPSRSMGRWSNATFDVLYTSLERDGALAEIHALLSDQPVFPSKPTWSLHRLSVTVAQALDAPDLAALAALGVEEARYRERRYDRTQEIADAAFFLGFDALAVASARWPCRNLVLFTEHLAADCFELEETEQDIIEWPVWRRTHKRS